MRTGLQIYVTAVFLQKIRIVRYHPLISDNATTGKSNLKRSASTVQRIPIRNDYSFAAHLLGKSSFTITNHAVLVPATTVMRVDVTLRMQHVLDD